MTEQQMADRGKAQHDSERQATIWWMTNQDGRQMTVEEQAVKSKRAEQSTMADGIEVENRQQQQGIRYNKALWMGSMQATND